MGFTTRGGNQGDTTRQLSLPDAHTVRLEAAADK